LIQLLSLEDGRKREKRKEREREREREIGAREEEREGIISAGGWSDYR